MKLVHLAGCIAAVSIAATAGARAETLYLAEPVVPAPGYVVEQAPSYTVVTEPDAVVVARPRTVVVAPDAPVAVAPPVPTVTRIEPSYDRYYAAPMYRRPAPALNEVTYIGPGSCTVDSFGTERCY